MPGTSLVKDKNYEVIPGTPGTSAIPGVPVTQGTPGYYSTEPVYVTSCYPTICSRTAPGFSSGFSGYDQPCSKVMVCNTSLGQSSVWHPATPGTPGTSGTPGIPATAGDLIEHLNEGWNSHSRSKDTLELGQYLSYRTNSGVTGILLSIGEAGKDSDKINAFSHSVLIEPDGVIVFEGGIKTKIVKNFNNVDSRIRLYRQPDNKVVCVVINGTETLVHVFDNIAYDLVSVPLYVYAHLYIAEDAVEDALLNTGKVTFGEA